MSGRKKIYSGMRFYYTKKLLGSRFEVTSAFKKDSQEITEDDRY